MDIIVCLIVGIINGLFSSGAGQLFIFYLVYILKQDTKKSRELSLTIMPIISIPTFIFYNIKSGMEMKKAIIFIFISLLFGFLGNFTMKKLNGNILNLISGILLIVVTTISLWRII